MSKAIQNVANKNNRKFDAANIVFLIGLIIIVLAFIVVMSIIIIRPGEVKSIEKIDEVSIDNYNLKGNENRKEYLVFVYASTKNEYYDYSTYRNEMVEKNVLEYATYAKDKKDALPIFRLDVSKFENRYAIKDLNLGDESYVPAILKLKFNDSSSSVTVTKKTVADVNEYLVSLMK